MLDPELVPKGRRVLPTTAAIEISRLPAELQLPLALRVQKGEVTLSGLRGEVVSVSRRHGLHVQERKKEPHNQRQAIERKIDLVRGQSIELRELIEETEIPVLRGWTARLGYRHTLTETQDDVTAAIAALDRVNIVGQRRP